MSEYSILFVLTIEIIRILITRKFALVFLKLGESRIKYLNQDQASTDETINLGLNGYMYFCALFLGKTRAADQFEADLRLNAWMQFNFW